MTATQKPAWLKVRLPSHGEFFRVAEIVKAGRLHTICQSARCPNIGECWERRTATFLILGDVCTRRCGFCAVTKGTPLPPDPEEPARLAEAAASLGLAHAVITSVTRDDLPDGGAAHFAAVIAAIRAKSPGTRIEALIPDFGGDAAALETVLAARPDVLNHNLETTESLYPAIRRPRENYRRSIAVLAAAKARGALTKSGLMIGLGETEADVLQAFADLRRAGCDLLTVGQYLQPTAAHPPVVKYYAPEEFEALAAAARRAGFREVVSGPLVRSSYEAGRLYEVVRRKDEGTCAT
ncbi:MAG TPA: lipoyl synthase [Candidatus Aminicenantes bacterium]|nr:lipoyl synthase [Candidatus Aminicenantes bacterium]HRY63806.1 lipoyl synthase [Candidatus Aminicenantes bacterium]HRZ70719.1 lipoyl synthase [Candidatus Aminicenantes bacterium]